MNVILVMVCSLNGKITRGDDPVVTNWSSPEDQKLFASLIEESNLIVMGKKTYEAGKLRMKLQKGKLRIVLTRNPEKYQSIPGQLEFTDQQPRDLVKRLEEQGYQHMLLVGGGNVNAMFFKEHLINEIHLTVEPLLFGKGKPLVAEDFFEVPLRLIEMKKLNKKGTLYLVYTVTYT